MDEQMRLLISMLKDRVNANLQVIHLNEVNNRIILNQPVSTERSRLLNESFDRNKKLLQENQETINLELLLLNYLNKYKTTSNYTQGEVESSQNDEKRQKIENQSSESFINESNTNLVENISDEDLLNMTISGEIDFDQNHQKFNDEEFIDNLIKNFTELENYEMCSKLLRLKRRKLY